MNDERYRPRRARRVRHPRRRAVTDARTLARQIGLAKAMGKYDLRAIVTFHSRIDNATRFAASLPE